MKLYPNVREGVTMKNHDLLKAAYAAFNRRDINAALAGMHPEVKWAHGRRDGTRPSRGTRVLDPAMGLINPRVEPISFEEDGAGRVIVKARQVVRDLKGTVIADRMVWHAYAFEDDLIKSMEIKEPGGPDCDPDRTRSVVER
jgi:hypothetical protein